MNPQQKAEAIGEEDVEQTFQRFLETMTTIESLIAEENTEDEVAELRASLDTLYDLGEETYCALAGNSRSIPDNYADLQWAVSERAKHSPLTEDEIYDLLGEVRERTGDIDARTLWTKTLSHIEREEQMQKIRSGPQTTTADWK